MIAYRILNKEYFPKNWKGSFSQWEKLAYASVTYGNRWNLPGQYAVYASASRALAFLENLIHRITKISLISDIDFLCLHIDISDELITIPKIDDISNLSYQVCQAIGDDYFKKDFSVLQVPSVVIPQENNFVINAKSDSVSKGKIKILTKEKFVIDGRFFEKK